MKTYAVVSLELPTLTLDGGKLLAPRSGCFCGNISQLTVEKRLGGSQSRSWRIGEEKCFKTARNLVINLHK
jgi:hypothetical protein